MKTSLNNLPEDLAWLIDYSNADDSLKIEMLFKCRDMVSLAKIASHNSNEVMKVIEEIQKYETL